LNCTGQLGDRRGLAWWSL